LNEYNGEIVMEKLYIYTRVSTKSQEEEGTSLETQKEMGVSIAEKLGMKGITIDEGGKSSWKDNLLNRPRLTELLEDAENGLVKYLWVFNTDRLGRKDSSWYGILSVLIKHKVSLYVGESTKPYDFNSAADKLTVTILSSISQYDNELRRSRMILGKKRKLSNGSNWVGGTPPFGYVVKDKKLIIDPKSSKMVKRMFDWYNKGWSMQKIKDKLDLSEFEPARSKRGWNIGTIISAPDINTTTKLNILIPPF